MNMCGLGGVGGYDQLCCQSSPKLLLGLDLGLVCDNFQEVRHMHCKITADCVIFLMEFSKKGNNI